MTEITAILKEIGLTDYETRIYNALLGLGKATSGEILKKAELKTGKVYEILDALEKKGLVSVVIEQGVKRFSPADPRRLKDYLDEKKNRIDEQEKNLQQVIPEIMERIQAKKGKISIEIFTGIKGFKTAYKKQIDYYNPQNTLYAMGIVSLEKYKKEVRDFLIYNLYPLREKSKVKIRKILGEDARAKRKEHEKRADIKYLNYASILTFNIIGNLTTLGINLEDPIAISIESEEVAKSFIEQFEMLWKQAKY